MKTANVFAPVKQLALATGSASGQIAVPDPTRFPIGGVVNCVKADGSAKVTGVVVGYVSPNKVKLVKQTVTDNGAYVAGGTPVDLSAYLVNSIITCVADQVNGTWTPDYKLLIPGTTTALTLIDGECATTPTLVGGVLYRFCADIDSYIKINATATKVTDFYVPAKVPVTFAAGHLGESPVFHVAAGAGGTGYLTPMIPALGEV